ncbi:unnamed protein product [Hermetia illucens]|uniref:Gustatory receptor n=1 Tax=Hermetia illucens TaxID=343691 RepID=A0A7R8YR08_HERIL|nr:unnamed protein product [Hermetia illucens]
MELCADLEAARMRCYLVEKLRVKFDSIYLWTDSKITLYWIRSSKFQKDVFVYNRVQEIQQLTANDNWNHCPGSINPADLLTRGVSAQTLLSCETWLNGPSWLYNDINHRKYFRRATREDFIYNGSFHEAVGSVLLFAQLFGVMPVTGVKAKDIRGLSFSYFSIIFIYSLIVFISLAFYFSTTLYFTFCQQLRLENIGIHLLVIFSLSRIVIKAFLDPVIFYGSIVCIYYKFGNLARQWPKLMQKWEKIERNLPEHPTQLSKAALAQRIKMVAIVVLMMSLIEHLLNIITIVHYANYCNTGQDPVQQVFKSQLSQLFYITEFSVFKAIFGKLVNVIATFTWNYMDLFVMVVSIGLSDKFRQVNASLFRMKGKVTSESYWSQHRDHYRSLCRLCEDIDNAISFITMFSFSNNLYFICVQLLRSLNKMPSFAHTLYFWFSLVFLIGRTLAVSLYSAEINDESKRPVQVFRCVPKESWCLEVKRFSEEVNTDIVALSGMKFFHLTRTLVLSVAGTIVTYELVLIQFHVQEGYLGCY